MGDHFLRAYHSVFVGLPYQQQIHAMVHLLPTVWNSLYIGRAQVMPKM